MSSTSPTGPEPAPVPTHEPVPESAADPVDASPEDHLLIDPTRVRRAPRYPVFLTLGAIVGIVGGLWFGQFLVNSVESGVPGTALLKPGVFVTVTVLGTTTFTMLLAGLVAVLLDRRSIRRQGR